MISPNSAMIVRTQSLLKFLVIFTAYSPGFSRVEAEAQPDLGQTLKNINQAYLNFKNITNLTIELSLHYEHVSGRRISEFETIEMVFMRGGAKTRLTMKGFMPNKGALYRDYAWDGKKGTSLEMVLGAKGGDYTISPKMDTRLLYYNYYVNYLNYPDATGSVAKLVNPAFSKKLPDMSWLPQSMIDDQKILILRTAALKPNSNSLILIERQGKASYLFDPAKGHALIQYTVLADDGKRIKSKTTYDSFEKVGESWLPKKIVLEEYIVFDGSMGVMDNPNVKEGELAGRKTLTVKSFRTEPIQPDSFIVPAPVGVKVHDTVKNVIYTHFAAGENKFVEAAEMFVRERSKSSGMKNNQRRITAGVVVLLLLSIILAFRLLYKKRASKTSSVNAE